MPLFLAQFHIFLFCYICKYWLQNSFKKVHNYFQHRKDKAQTDALTRLCMRNRQPHVTAVKIALSIHTQTNCQQCLLEASHNRLCIYKTKHNYNRIFIIFF